MAQPSREPLRSILALILLAAMGPTVQAQSPLIRTTVDETILQTLQGDTPPELAAAIDLGELPSDTPVHRLQILLSRSAAQQAALEQFLRSQHDSTSPDYHHWLTPAEFGKRFSPAQSDLDTVTAWLTSQGFTEVTLNPAHTLIEANATAGSVATAFHTRLHKLQYQGAERIANLTDPAIPAALAPAIQGIVSLNNLPATATSHLVAQTQPVAITPLAQSTSAHPSFTISSAGKTFYAITPYDFATLYDILPLWSAATPVDGTGQTIAVVGDTDFNPADFVAFRTLFGLPLGNTATATGTEYLSIIYNGLNPGVRPDEAQADIDTQWATAVAKGATIDYVASVDTEVSRGIDLSAAYIVNNNLAGILTDSFSKCELALGTTGNAFYKSLWQQAAAQGITVLTASGDSGSAACDLDTGPPASGGLAISGIASTPYTTTIGGTDFLAPTGLASYFGSNSSTTLASALRYIPETTWNDTCANAQLNQSAPYLGMTAEQVCNTSSALAAGLLQTSGSGGGPSACTTSSGTSTSCSGGYPKPTWQTGTGVPVDGARDIPDLAFFASKGRQAAFYFVCQQSLNTDGKACNASAPYSDFAAYGGTGVTTPAFAGVVALIAQQTGTRLGNINYILYGLANRQQQAGTPCNASGTVSSACIFHDITSGNNANPCLPGSANCFTANPSDTYGILSSAFAGTGYDETTGLGSVDVANLAQAWPTVAFTSTTAILTLTPQTITHGSPVSATVSVTAPSGTPTGSVSILAQTANGALGSGTLANGTYTATLTDLPGGSYGVRAHYGGDASFAAADSNFVSVTVTPENSTTTLAPLEINSLTGAVTTGVTSAPYGSVFFLRADVAGRSGQGTATGNVLINDNNNPIASGTYRLNSSGYTEAQVNSLVPGTHLFSASYTGDSSFNPSTANNASLTITLAPTTLALATSASTVSADSTVTLTATINTQGYGYYTPSGLVTFYNGATVLGQTELVPGKDATTFADLSTAAFTLAASSLPRGLNTISVTFPGDSNYLPSASNTVSITVTAPTLTPTVTVASASPVFVTPGNNIAFSANVTPAATGTIQFLVDNQNIGAPITLSGSSASLTETVPTLQKLLVPIQTLLSGGAHTLTAVYSGSATLSSSVSAPRAFSVVIPTVASLPVITVTPSSAVQGTFVSVAVQITPTTPNATGTAQLVLDGGLYGAIFPLTSGAVTLPLATGTLQVGSHVLSVAYSGDTVYKSSYAANTTLTILAPGSVPSSAAIVNLPPQIAQGNTLYFAVDVAPNAPIPTGIVQLILDSGTPGTPVSLVNGAAPESIDTSALTLGTHTLSAFYSGDSTYSFSTAPTTSFIVLAPGTIPPGTFTLTPSEITTIASRFGINPPSITFTASPGANFSALVNFTCSGLPGLAKCVFTPTALPLSTAPASTVLTFDLSSLAVEAIPPARPWLPVTTTIAVAGLLLLAPFKRAKSRWNPLLACLLLATLAAASGCGSGFHNSHSGVGDYNVVVTATGGGYTQTATVHLTIQ